MMQALNERDARHQAFDWRTCWEGPDRPRSGPMGRTGSKVRAVQRVIEALTIDIPPGVPARAEIYRVNVFNDAQHRDLVVAERDAGGAIRWSGELNTVPPDVEAKLPGFPDTTPTG